MHLEFTVGMGVSSGTFQIEVVLRSRSGSQEMVPLNPPVLVDIRQMVLTGQLDYCDQRRYPEDLYADRVIPVLKLILAKAERWYGEGLKKNPEDFPIERSPSGGAATLTIFCDLNPFL